MSKLNLDTPKSEQDYPSIANVGFRSCCPSCGKGQLYNGLLSPAPSCSMCGLSFEFIDSGDGPAVFVILAIGFLVTALALVIESALALPLWMHFFLWLPLVILLSIWGLRFAKSLMIAMQFRTKAQEGRIEGAEK